MSRPTRSRMPLHNREAYIRRRLTLISRDVIQEIDISRARMVLLEASSDHLHLVIHHRWRVLHPAHASFVHGEALAVNLCRIPNSLVSTAVTAINTDI